MPNSFFSKIFANMFLYEVYQ